MCLRASLFRFLSLLRFVCTVFIHMSVRSWCFSHKEKWAPKSGQVFFGCVCFMVHLRSGAFVVFVRASCDWFQLRACMLAVVC